MNSDTSLPLWQTIQQAEASLKGLVPKEPVADDVAVLVRALEAGLPRKFACHLAGRSSEWYYDKRHNDPNFEILTDKAIAKGIETRVTRINKHAKRNWQADAWMLSRTHPKDFAEPSVALSQEVNVTSAPTNIVVVGPERAAILASRHEQIRAKTRELLAHRNPGSNGQPSSLVK